MGTLNETPVWEAGVRHFEANTVLTGGPDCPDNLPLIDLANRTAWLKQQVEAAQGGLAGHEAAADPHPQYLTSAEGDAKVAVHVADGDPHPMYWNNARGDTKIAAAIAALVNSSPAALDTLAELATALGNDPNFATTITNSLASKASQAGVQGQTYTAFTTTGATGAFILAPNPAISAYAAGQRFRVKFHAVGNGADSINVSGQGAKNLKQYDNTGAKVAAVIAANQLADVEYDGVDMILLDQLPPSVNIAHGSQTYSVAGTYTFTVPNGVNAIKVQAWGAGGGGGVGLLGTNATGGGSSSFGALLTATGGTAGVSGTNGAGGTGGIASGADYSATGGTGGVGGPSSTSRNGGDGGASPNGGAGGTGGTSTVTQANAGAAPGGGGGGNGTNGSTGGTAGSGGGGGGYGQGVYFVTPGVQYTITVGAGGSGGIYSGGVQLSGNGGTGQVKVTW